MDGQEMQRCDNCLKEYPQSKMATHYGYCRRNIKKCPTCHEMYDINFQEEHDQEYHKMEKCQYCQKEFNSNDVKKHQTNCHQKPKYCQYCDLNVPKEIYNAHVKECQSRTKPCTKCNKPITNKQYLIHIVSCQGVKEEPKPVQPRNYQEHLQQQRKQFEAPAPVPSVVQSRSNDKIKRPSYQYKREEPKVRQQYKPREEYKVKEQKKYAPIVGRPQPKVISYQPPRPEVKQEQKRQPIKYPSTRQQVKKDDGKRYINSINPPSGKIITNTKRQEVRSGKVIETSQNQPMSLEQYNRRKGLTNKQPQKRTVNATNPVSNKDIFPAKNNYERPSYGFKPVKSIQKKVQQPKRQEKPLYPGTNNNRIVTKAPEPKTRVIYDQTSVQPAQNRGDFLHEEYALGALDMGGDDPELQMAIMQSMKGSSKNSSYSFEGVGDVNESFVAQQKAIEEEFKKNRRY